jgi:hypothetical protein
MAADLYIHVVTPDVTEYLLSHFNSNLIGSKWFKEEFVYEPEKDEDAYKKIAATPMVHVGEVSWLKAALFNDKSFIPQPVQEIADIIGEELPIIDDALINKVRNALRAPNDTSYEINDNDEIISFLIEHKGKKCFTVSW